MFKVIVDPGDGKSLILAITVKNDVITVYENLHHRKWPDEKNNIVDNSSDQNIYFSGFFSKSANKVSLCNDRIAADYEKQFNKPILFMLEKAPVHDLHHECNDDKEIIHYHLKYPKEISYRELQHLLSHYEQCQNASTDSERPLLPVQQTTIEKILK